MALNYDIIISAVDKATSVLNGVGSSIASSSKKINQSFEEIRQGAMVATGAIAAISGVGLKLAIDAGKFESVKDSFNSMVRGIDADELIGKVKEATQFTVDSQSVLKTAVRAFSLIGEDSFTNFSDDFTKMATLSKKAARAMAIDVDYAMDSLVMGVGRGSKLLLDNLGINVDLQDAYETFAIKVGKSSKELTTQEQKTALLNATLIRLEEQYGEVAVSAGGVSGAWQQTTAAFKDLRLEIGTALMPVVNEFLREVVIPFGKKYGPLFVEWIKRLMEKFSNLSPKIQEALLIFIALSPVLFGVLAILPKIGTALKLLFSPLGIVIGFVTALWAILDKIVKEQTGHSFFDQLIALFELAKIGAQDLYSWVQALIYKVQEFLGLNAGGGGGSWGDGGFAVGGTIPGALGAPRMALVHGGERVIPAQAGGGGGGKGGGSGVSLTVNVGTYVGSETEKRRLAEELYRGLVQLAQRNNQTVQQYLGA